MCSPFKRLERLKTLPKCLRVNFRLYIGVLNFCPIFVGMLYTNLIEEFCLVLSATKISYWLCHLNINNKCNTIKHFQMIFLPLLYYRLSLV